MRELTTEAGIYKSSETAAIQATPKDFGMGAYFMPSTLGNADTEEAAARILLFSKQLDSWVGVSWLRLVQQMQEDLEQDQRYREAQQAQQERKWAHERKLWQRKLWCVFTLGLYALLVKRPVLDEQELPTAPPFSLIFVMGPQKVVDGIHRLLERGMLTQQNVGEGEDETEVFFPTDKLISTIRAAQGGPALA